MALQVETERHWLDENLNILGVDTRLTNGWTMKFVKFMPVEDDKLSCIIIWEKTVI